MEDHLRPVGPESEIQARGHTDIADHRNEIQPRELLFQFEAEVVHRRFGIVEQDQAADPEAGELPAEFGADGAGAAGHQHHLALEIGLDGFQVDLDLLPAEQVLDLDLADMQLFRRIAGHLVHGGSD